jgi:hypothetical protein
MCSLLFENNNFSISCVRYAWKIIFFLSNVFASLQKWFSFYLMCSLRFENNFLTIGHVRVRFENSCLAIECVPFTSKIIYGLSKCSLHFKNNLLTIEGVRFASISKKTPLSKLSFGVLLALPLVLISILLCDHMNSVLTVIYPLYHIT